MATMTTRRRQHTGRLEALRHKVYGPTRIPGRTTVNAVCGAQVGIVLDEPWDPTHPRACTSCARIAP